MAPEKRDKAAHFSALRICDPANVAILVAPEPLIHPQLRVI
jgi:hypothetical protein